jgi:hypothetical protein
MDRLRKYDHYLILERFDKNIKQELIKLGITDKEELGEYIRASKKGYLAQHINERGGKFTFGLLNAIFKDSIYAKKNSDLKVGFVKMMHRIVPIALAPYFPILAIIGYIFGTSRAFNKMIVPIISNPSTEFTGFLKKLIDAGMKISEGEIKLKDRFSRAFVVSDNITEAIKPEVLHKFSIELSKKMSEEDSNKEVPENYIENELKQYLNDNFNIDPKIPLKNDNL